ncbi:MAG TPA: M48 family metalloprotease [Syntrophobacter fumaroxidans]|nr:M48 family metalloprotease [Syntrophobacter fumaroxidans]
MRLRSRFCVPVLVLAPLCLVLLLSIRDCRAASLGDVLRIPGGVVNSGQADSIVRGAKAIGKTFQDITPEQEYYIGRAVAATILQSYRPYPDEDANRYLNVLGQSLAQASDRPETFGGYHFLILDSEEINAFAAPGGLILVTRGMLRLCRDEDQVAAVLAHEIGHIKGRHGLRAIRTSRLTTAFTVLAAEGAKNFGGSQVAQLTEAFEGSVSDVTATLTNSGYSRELEREADQEAVAILIRIGYDPGALSSMLQEMDKRMVRSGPGFAKTHPDPKDRVQAIGARAGTSPRTASPPERKKRFDLFMSKV